MFFMYCSLALFFFFWCAYFRPPPKNSLHAHFFSRFVFIISRQTATAANQRRSMRRIHFLIYLFFRVWEGAELLWKFKVKGWLNTLPVVLLLLTQVFFLVHYWKCCFKFSCVRYVASLDLSLRTCSFLRAYFCKVGCILFLITSVFWVTFNVSRNAPTFFFYASFSRLLFSRNCRYWNCAGRVGMVFGLFRSVLSFHKCLKQTTCCSSSFQRSGDRPNLCTLPEARNRVLLPPFLYIVNFPVWALVACSRSGIWIVVEFWASFLVIFK